MEKIKPVKGKSPISSLNFQQKSDFKKFLKFIQDQTKELREVKKPKENKIKSALKIGAIGLGGLGIAGLFGAAAVKDKDDEEFVKSGQEGGDFDIYAAIGRRNEPGIKTPRIRFPFKGGTDPREVTTFGKRGTRTRSVRERDFTKEKGIGAAEKKAEENAKKKRDEIKRRRKRFTYNRLRDKSKVGANLVEVGETQKIEYKNRTIRKRKVKLPEGTPPKIDKGIKTFINPKPGEVEATKKFLNQKKLTQRTFGRFIKDKNFRRDTARAADQAFVNMNNIPDDPRLKDIESDPRGNKIRTGIEKETGTKIKDFKTDKFTRRSTRPGVNTFSNRDPFGRITDTLSTKGFPEKSRFAKLTRRLLRGNAKITTDSFLGISYKGPKFSTFAKAINNPAAKVVFFGLDVFNAVQSGKQVFNLKDNLGTALYDLYVSIHNTINKDNPENLKEYYTVPSDEKFLIKQTQRNMRIRELKNQATGGVIVDQNKNANNIIVVPQNQQNTNMSSGNNIPTQTGGVDLSLVPFEPLNIGDDILLHKLNQ